MARRVFISYEGHDRNKAKGFHLLRWNENVDIEFVGRHLLDPVDSSNRDYVSEKIREQIKGSSITVVLIGQHTKDSEWVTREVEWSLRKSTPNGVLGIRLDPSAPLPSILEQCGAEIMPWRPHEFADAFKRAIAQAGRASTLARASAVGGGNGCIR